MVVLTVRREQSWHTPSVASLTALINRAMRWVPHPNMIEVGVMFVGDVTMRRLHTQYRKKRKTTDVLSFCYTPQPKLRVGTGQAKTKKNFLSLLEGDIVISFPQARRQAAHIGQSVREEISFLFIHGFLHLLGYDHERSTTEEKRMFALQDRILGRK